MYKTVNACLTGYSLLFLQREQKGNSEFVDSDC